MNLRNRMSVLLWGILVINFIHAQKKGVVLDINTHHPIPYVNVYTLNKADVSGTTSNENGCFVINFPFKLLSFSHINYEKKEVTRGELNDTVFLKPVVNQIGEVVINNKEPEWIERILKKVVAQRDRSYRSVEKNLAYQYSTCTLSDSSGYSFKSEGDIFVPSLNKNALFRIYPRENTIYFKDTKAGVDFSNMQRMLYSDFVIDFNNNFIKEHQFRQNYAYSNTNPNVVQIIFDSKKYEVDEGYILIDTISYAILEAERNSGTEFNVKEQTTDALRAIASMRGFKYEEWITNSFLKYEEIEGVYYLSHCKYKFYIKSQTTHKKTPQQYFTSIESELVMTENKLPDVGEYIDLPKPQYLLLIKTKKMRKEEEKLQNVPVAFRDFF